MASLPSDIRRSNRRAVLRALYPNRWRSRADLAKITGLSKVSVSDVVATLIDDGLLVEGGYKPSSKPGKPALLVGIQVQGMNVIGLDLAQAGTLKGILTDLEGHVLARASIPAPDAKPMPLNPIMDLCKRLQDQSKAPILGLGIASPGTVDTAGRVLAAPNLGWADLSLAQALREGLGLEVCLANDADSAVFGERCFGGGPANMILVQIARGVGAGVLIDDRIVHGSHYVAGEIGHVVIDENGIPCACGKRGCLETTTSVPSLTARIAQAPERREEIITLAGQALGSALSMPVALTNIDDIVVAGPASIATATMLETVQNTINDRVRSRFIEAVRVRPSALGSDAAALGGVAGVLRERLGVF
ncbi:hypothetical protein AB656_02685 [Bifidobacterium actinocoloniiforme DSM 22766]|nr:hypothetical protein AB656_02685 [Bifidobacterium actinocoloniiforme DSM 22766]